MDNKISGYGGHAVSSAAPASSSAQRNNKNRASSQASASLAASVAAQLQHERILGGLEVVLSNRPETAPQILQAYKKEMAAEHGLAQLYQVLDRGDLGNLPTLEALTVDLQEICQVDSMTDITFIPDLLDLLANQVPRLFNQPVVPHAVVVSLAELSHLLLKAIENDIDSEMSTRVQWKEHILLQLGSLFNLADDGGPKTAHLKTTLDVVRLNLIRHSLRNDANLMAAAIRNDGNERLLNFADELRNDPDIVMAAIALRGD